MKRIFIKYISSDAEGNKASATALEKEDPSVFWREEGRRREPEKAEYSLPDEDFFGNEKTEFSEDFFDELKTLSEEEAEAVLSEAGLIEKKGGTL